MDAKGLEVELNKVIKKLYGLLDFSDEHTEMIHEMEAEHIAEAIRHLERIYIKGIYIKEERQVTEGLSIEEAQEIAKELAKLHQRMNISLN